MSSLPEAKVSLTPNGVCIPMFIAFRAASMWRIFRGPNWTHKGADQKSIPRRLGLSLIASVAKGRPNWQLVMVAPVTKWMNVYYRESTILAENYKELPVISGWLDIALMSTLAHIP
jgi:hypothetical protein